jgi:hypothetical protein
MCNIECFGICVLCAVLVYWIEWVKSNLGSVWMSCNIRNVFAAKRYCPMLIEEGGSVKLLQMHDNAEVNPSVRGICRNILDVLAAE